MKTGWHAAALACVLTTANAAWAAAPDCAYDRARLLALDQDAFDQDMQGGWRPLSARPGCEPAAADLIRDYRQAHGLKEDILFWHEGQMRATAGQSEAAAALMEAARRPQEQDAFGWNPYVDATIAFLRRDRPAFDAAQARLAAVPAPPGQEVRDGMIEVHMSGGQVQKMRWPMNVDVVEGLGNCFDKPYREAYDLACRKGGR